MLLKPPTPELVLDSDCRVPFSYWTIRRAKRAWNRLIDRFLPRLTSPCRIPNPNRKKRWTSFALLYIYIYTHTRTCLHRRNFLSFETARAGWWWFAAADSGCGLRREERNPGTKTRWLGRLYVHNLVGLRQCPTIMITALGCLRSQELCNPTLPMYLHTYQKLSVRKSPHWRRAGIVWRRSRTICVRDVWVRMYVRSYVRICGELKLNVVVNRTERFPGNT